LAVVLLSGGGLYGTYAYRSLVKSLSARTSELPLAAELSQNVSDLRVTLTELHALREGAGGRAAAFPENRKQSPLRTWMVRDQFRSQLDDVEETLARYRHRLENKLEADCQISDNQPEWDTVHKIEAALGRVRQANADQDWMFDEAHLHRLDNELSALQTLAADLPSHLHSRLGGFADEVRGEYRTLIVGMWVMGIAAALVLALFVQLFFRWIVSPLHTLIDGSRRVAKGDFNFRIRLATGDEMSELGEALNDMTERFQAIRDDLDRQVRERTRQAVRSEQLASVGFLAAGVAHEINNPLASIAMCAESLEARVSDLQAAAGAEGHVIADYLRMIQSEAFRCKEITEKLLDFARAGPTHRVEAELGELVQGVIDVVRHLGKYQRKTVCFEPSGAVYVAANPQEIKQVVLNLLTNALDSLDDGGEVRVALSARQATAELTVTDNGCGMDTAVLKHIFEPFFTRRRPGTGPGTGLGLSISYRIVVDHGGQLEGESDGPGRGSTFRMRLPLCAAERAETKPLAA
jgi:signal transduction histidine kinase